MNLLDVSPDVSLNDAQLVALALSGNRDAFEKIVLRYQALIASLAYSATGNLGQSEDLAQETFLTAWRKLANLEEPAKLKSWLCGIARHRIIDALRAQGREPSHAAESLDLVENTASREPLPNETAMSQEEEALLWRSVERIPESYRLPLILYYREHQSIDLVASALELTEEATRQRLARGRKFLQAEVFQFVETAFERTRPGKSFTRGVMAIIPAVRDAGAGQAGTITAKVLAAAKLTTTSGLVGSVIGLLTVFSGNYFGYRLGMRGAQSFDERKFIKTFYLKLLFCFLGFQAIYLPAMFWGSGLLASNPRVFAALAFILGAAWIALAVDLVFWAVRTRRGLVRKGSDAPSRPTFEYRSQVTWFGLPVIHAVVGGNSLAQGPVRAWIAIGPKAVGVIFAFGGLAIAPISIGGFAIGLVPWGGTSLGLFAVGGLAVGGWAWGGIAIGWQAFGGFALAWEAAAGGIAMARDFAAGSVAFASEANSPIAAEWMDGSVFFRSATAAFQSPYLFLANLFWVIPLAIQSRMTSRTPRSSRGNLILWLGGISGIIFLFLAIRGLNSKTAVEISERDQEVGGSYYSTNPSPGIEGRDEVLQQSPEGHYLPNPRPPGIALPVQKLAPTPPSTVESIVLLLADPKTPFLEKNVLWQDLRDRGALDSAIDHLKELQSQHPTEAGYPLTLGEAYIEKIRVASDPRDPAIFGLKADQSFDEALALNPSNWEAAFFKATSLGFWPPALDKGPEVIQRFQELIGRQESSPSKPEFAESYLQLGDFYLRSRKLDFARQTWQRGAAFSPAEPRFQKRLSSNLVQE